MRKLCLIGLLAAISTLAQDAPKGAVERVKLNGTSLAGNLSGDSPERDVSVYLPASYAKAKKQRYPVLYFLHGFTDSDEKWFGHNGVKHWIHLPTVLDQAGAEIIVVMPNALTRFGGSFYGSSPATGDWERFVTQELVSFIDSKYRTLARAESRGLAGHSMGGYGTLRLGMKYPEVFGAIYALSPCCLAASDPRRANPAMARLEQFKTDEEVAKGGFLAKAMFASAAAWSPNPKNPPFYVDLPTKGGETQFSTYSRWAANAPLAMAEQYLPNWKKLRAIALDSGDKDQPIGATTLEFGELLARYGIPHTAEIYPGDHLSGIAERIRKKAMPFFTRHLVAKPAK